MVVVVLFTAYYLPYVSLDVLWLCYLWAYSLRIALNGIQLPLSFGYAICAKMSWSSLTSCHFCVSLLLLLGFIIYMPVSIYTDNYGMWVGYLRNCSVLCLPDIEAKTTSLNFYRSVNQHKAAHYDCVVNKDLFHN